MVDTTPVTRPSAIIAIAAACLTGLASAQVIRLSPVEAGRDDTSPILTSLRAPATDLRTPVDFEKVYRVTSDTRLLGRAGSRRDALYARVNNGLIAIFPKSSYDGLGGSATVPADTVWILADTRVDNAGESIDQATPTAPRPATTGATLLDRRMNQRSLERSLTPEPIEPPPPPRGGMDTSIPCVFDSEEARQARISRLLDVAHRRGR
jgi:hypothetical protein